MTLTSPASLPPKRERRPLHRQPLIVIPYLLSMAVALFWPEEGWRNVLLDAVADFFVTHIPSVNAYVRKSEYPEVMRAYFSLTFFVFLPAFLLLLKDRDVLFGVDVGFLGQLRKISGYVFPRLIIVFGVVFFLFLCFVAYAQSGYQFNLFPLLEKRWALAVLGPIVGWFGFQVIFVSVLRQLQFFWILTFKEGV